MKISHLMCTLALILSGLAVSPGWGDEEAAPAQNRRLADLEEEIKKLRADQDQSRKRMEMLLEELEKLKKEPARPDPKAVRLRFDVLSRFAQERFGDPITQLVGNSEGVLNTRVRAFLDAPIAPNLDGGLMLTTGQDPNPASPFIRLGEISRGRTFNLGRAYLRYKPFRDNQNVTVTLGKMPNPVWRGDAVGNHNSELIWDDDVNPEGITLNATVPSRYTGKSLQVSNLLGYLAINNPSEQRFQGLNEDTFLLLNQLTLEAPKARTKLGVSFYDYQGLNSGLRVRALDTAFGSFDVLPSADSFLLRPGLQATNNSVSYGAMSHGLVSDRFTMVNFTGQYNFPEWFKGRQLYFLADGIQNFRVRRDRKGYGLTVGGRSKHQDPVGSFNTWLTYRSVDADSVIGPFADSDLGQGSDYRGFELGGAIKIQPKTTLQISFFNFKQHPFKHINRQRVFVDVYRAF